MPGDVVVFVLWENHWFVVTGFARSGENPLVQGPAEAGGTIKAMSIIVECFALWLLTFKMLVLNSILLVFVSFYNHSFLGVGLSSLSLLKVFFLLFPRGR